MKKFTSWTQQIGAWGETITVEYLSRRGFTILERNYTRRTGEIDIVSQKNGVLHFIEVKTLVKHGEYYDPFENVTKYKIRKMARTIAWYLLERKVSHETRWVIDAFSLSVVREERRATLDVLWNVTPS